MKPLNRISKKAVALPIAYQALLGLGVTGATSGLAYWLSGHLDRKQKHQTARAIGSAILGLSAGAGAIGMGNRLIAQQIVDKIRLKLLNNLEEEKSFFNLPKNIYLNREKDKFENMSDKKLENFIDDHLTSGDYPRGTDKYLKVGGLPIGTGFLK